MKIPPNYRQLSSLAKEAGRPALLCSARSTAGSTRTLLSWSCGVVDGAWTRRDAASGW